MTAYSGKSGHSKKLISYNGKATSKGDIFVQLAYECTEDKDDVDNHEHFNGSETICLKCFGYTNNCEQQQQTFGILLVMLLKILTRTRKTVTRIVILPGTLSGGTRKLGRNLINFFEKRRKLEKGINQLC